MTPPPKVPLSFNFHPQSLVFQRQGSNGVIWWQWISRRWRRTEHSWSSPPKVHLIIVCWRFPRLSVKTTQGSSGNYREWGFPLLPLRHRFIRNMKPLQFILFSITCNGEVKKGKTRLDCTDQNCLQRFVRCQMSGWGRSLGTLDRSSTRPKFWKGFTSHISTPVWSMAIVGGATKGETDEGQTNTNNPKLWSASFVTWVTACYCIDRHIFSPLPSLVTVCHILSILALTSTPHHTFSQRDMDMNGRDKGIRVFHSHPWGQS